MKPAEKREPNSFSTENLPPAFRKYFGALLVGFYEGKKFRGRVGTGFSDKLLRSLFSDLEKIWIERCPFSNLPALGRSRWDQGLTAAEMKRCHWVTLVMVCKKKIQNGRGMTVFGSQFFSESGKTKMRTKWFGKRQAKELQIQEPFNRADCREEYPPDAGTRFLLFTWNGELDPLDLSS